jgi:hypothetical protein
LAENVQNTKVRIPDGLVYRDLNKQSTTKEYIEDSFQTSRLAVLATERNGQPYTSLIAITQFGSFRKLKSA